MLHLFGKPKALKGCTSFFSSKIDEFLGGGAHFQKCHRKIRNEGEGGESKFIQSFFWKFIHFWDNRRPLWQGTMMTWEDLGQGPTIQSKFSFLQNPELFDACLEHGLAIGRSNFVHCQRMAWTPLAIPYLDHGLAGCGADECGNSQRQPIWRPPGWADIIMRIVM